MIRESLILTAHDLIGPVIGASVLAVVLAGIGIVRGERNDQQVEVERPNEDFCWPTKNYMKGK